MSGAGPHEAGGTQDGIEAEVITGEVEVMAEVRPVLPAGRTITIAGVEMTPAQAVGAVAAGGFVAGAATVVMARARSERKLTRRERRRAAKRKDRLDVVASRRFLVDVHLLGGRD